MKKVFLTFLTFVLYFNSFSLAHAAVGGWTMSNPIAQGASTVYNGAKTVVINGANVVKNGTAKITPTATNVAKVLARGGVTAALTVAVEQLIGAVDWVLDPANNQIKYTTTEMTYVGTWDIGDGVKYTSGEAAALAKCQSKGQTYRGVDKARQPPLALCTTTTGAYDQWSIVFNGTQVQEETPKSLPLTTVAAQVISNAESDTDAKVGAQIVTTAAAADIVAEAETDSTKARPIVQQLENSATTATDETATGESTTETDPETGKQTTDLSLEFPAFCGWAPSVCEAAQTVISFPTTLTEWWETSSTSISEAWTYAKDWATAESKPESDTEVDIQQDDAPQLDTDIFNASGECPPDFSYPFPLPLGGTYTITYSYATACYWFSKLYYIVVTVASLISIRIVSGTEGRSNG